MAGKNPTKEQIDERILRILNLEDIFDLDYGTYFTLIKEKLVEANITKKIPTEEVMLLREELKRIKGKLKKGGRFKPEKKKIKPIIKSLSGVKKKSEPKILPQSSLIENKLKSKNAEQEKTSNSDNNIKSSDNVYQSIIKSLNNITKILSNQFKFEKNAVEKQRKLEETNKRKSKEDELEGSFSKGIKALAKVAGKVFSPLQDFFTEIVNFLTRLFLAKAVSKFIDWFNDPKNKSKVETLGKLVEKFWPAILAGLVFLNPLGKLIAKATVLLIKGTAKLASVAIPAIGKFIKGKGLSGSIGRAAVASGTAAGLSAVANSSDEKSKGVQSSPTATEKGTPQYRTGGKITTNTGEDIRGAGVDTQLIAARPGEVVINKETVDAVGADYFLGLNKQYGGPNANKPKVAKGVQTASGGGLILPAFSNGGVIGDSSGGSAKIIEGAKSIIGKGAGDADQCANTTRAALKAAGHPAANKVTKIGDLDTPNGTAFSAPSFAASFGGTDMGQVITNKSSIKAGDIILWKADRDKGGNINKGAITHVGIAADDGLKNQYDHNVAKGFHYRPHWHSASGTSWFAGIRLPGSGGNVPPSEETATSSSGSGSVGSVGDSREGSKEQKEISKASKLPTLSFSMLYNAITGNKQTTPIGTTGTAQSTSTGTQQTTSTGTTGTQQTTSTGTQQSSVSDVVQGSSADTGSGWTVKGLKDQQGRPAIFSQGGAEAFSRMMKDSGGVVKGKDIASSQRSPQKNAAVGGVPNSKHLKGNALDIHGSSQTWMRANGKKYGWFINDYPGSHGGHFDYKGPAAGSGGASSPKKEGQEQESGQTKKDGAASKPSGGGSISGTGISKGVSIAKKLIGDMNIGPAAAAGIVGNLMLESGLQPDNVENGKGFKDGAINNIPPGTQRVGYGWGQWTNDRLERMRKFLKDRKADNRPATDDDNYAYLINELTTTEKIKGHWKGWQGKNIPEDDPKKAATWFMMNWERPGVPHEDKRQVYASDIFKQIKGISAGTKSSEETSDSSSSSGSSGQSSTSSSADSSKPESGASKTTGLTFSMLYNAVTKSGSKNPIVMKSNQVSIGPSSSPSGGSSSGSSSSPSGGSSSNIFNQKLPNFMSMYGSKTGTAFGSNQENIFNQKIPNFMSMYGPKQTNETNLKGSEIDKMSIEQLRTMLDPTKPGASNMIVFNAAKKAREEAVSLGLPKEEVERRVLVASVKAKQGISPQEGTSTLNNRAMIASGPIKENTGLSAPEGGADRRIITTQSGQTIRVQPGEYILTAPAVQKLGGIERLNQLLANLDRSSNPAKMGVTPKDTSQGIRPYTSKQSGKVDVQSLPMSGVGGGGGIVPLNSNGSEPPFHSPISQEGMSERQRILDILGATAFA